MRLRTILFALAVALFAVALIDGSPVPTSAAMWLTKSPMPTARTGVASAVVNGKLYMIGGVDGAGSTFYSTVEVYDPSLDTWSTVASMPTARANLATAVLGGKIYAVGGGNPGALATVEAYDPGSNTWSTASSMPTARSSLTAAAANGKLYAIGGTTNGFDDFSTVEQYDPGANTWATKSPMPTPRFGLGTAVVNNIIYAVAGAQPFLPLQTLEAYNPTTDTWTSKPSMSTVARYQLEVVAVGTTVWAIGGCYCPTLYDAVEVYDVGSNTWSTPVPPLTTARGGLAGGLINGVVYAVGGATGVGVASGVNEAYSLLAAGDSDGDGCPDARELGPSHMTGGQRNANSFWDFFDVPAPALLASNTTGLRNKAISIQDVIAILAYIGTNAANPNTPNASGATYGSDLNGNGIADGQEYDRTAGLSAWAPGPPNGAVSIADALLELNGIGDHCN